MNSTVDVTPWQPQVKSAALCLLLALLAFVAGALGAYAERRWAERARVDTPQFVSLDVAALLAAMARAAPPGSEYEEERATQLVEALQIELKTLSANEIVILNAAAVVAGVEDLTPVLKERLLSATFLHLTDKDE